MDRQLQEKLAKWHQQIERVKEAEATCLQLEASEKSFFAQLYLNQQAKTVAEREQMTFALKEWETFKKGLAEAISTLNHEKRNLALIQKSFDATYLTYKVEATAITRG